MTSFEFIDKYCQQYHLLLHKEENGHRLKGGRLLSIKLLVYIIRIYFDSPSFDIISNMLQISRQSAMTFYYSVLASQMYRNLCETRYKEIMDVRHIQESR